VVESFVCPSNFETVSIGTPLERAILNIKHHSTKTYDKKILDCNKIKYLHINKNYSFNNIIQFYRPFLGAKSLYIPFFHSPNHSNCRKNPKDNNNY
jgi:hypothetical protein